MAKTGGVKNRRDNIGRLSPVSSASTKPAVTMAEENSVSKAQPTKGKAARGDFMNETPTAREQTPTETGEDFGVREKLNIPRCQYGVPCSFAYQDGYIANCDDPAIAKWTWKSGSMFVCEEHDKIVEEAEEDKPVSAPSQTVTATTKEQKTSLVGGGVETKTDEEIAREAARRIWVSLTNEDKVDDDTFRIVLSAIRESRASVKE